MSTPPKKPRKPRAKSPTLDQIEKALKDSYGTVAVAAAALGMRRDSLSRRITKSPRLQAVRDTAREFIIDTAELRLMQHLNHRDPRTGAIGSAWAISLVLKTLGRSRGYGDVVQILTDNAPDLSKLSDEELRALVAHRDDGATS